MMKIDTHDLYSDTLGVRCQFVYPHNFAGRPAGHVCGLSRDNSDHDTSRKREYNMVHEFVEPPLAPVVEYLRQQVESSRREIADLRDEIERHSEGTPA